MLVVLSYSKLDRLEIEMRTESGHSGSGDLNQMSRNSALEPEWWECLQTASSMTFDISYETLP